ncbi:class I SAM-dependent methyltransferase [Zunongwangia sp.]|uniref:class I SAM-dependent methyltransferase n=1 Tax=Zunongwangia sp. TaxID=1965325 RepID=UPI003AA7DB71
MNDIIGKKLEKIRINKVLPFIKGKLLDIGCGNNGLKDTYGNGIGVDVYDWGNVDLIVKDTSKIPLKTQSVDTITIIAALNHIPNRGEVIYECQRLLCNDGKLIITMIPPIISTVWHFLRKPWDVDQSERGMKEGEVYGMTSKQIIELAKESGFKLKKVSSFMFAINKLYVFEKNKIS